MFKVDAIRERPVHFIGCGGAGMAPMAMIMNELGIKVSGSDLESGERIDALSQRGIPVTLGHSITALPEAGNALVVYSSAVPDSNPELKGARKRGIECVRRGEMLARLCSCCRRTVSVSGSHGKTTIAAMLVHILRTAGRNIGYMVGGKINGMPAFAAGDGDVFVTEVDESDGTNALMDSHIAVIPNVEDDHCWSVGGFENLIRNFKTYAARAPKIIYLADDCPERIFDDHPDRIAMRRSDILRENYFEYFEPYLVQSWGDYQLVNAALAIEAAVELRVPFDTAMRTLSSFQGVARRMTEHFKNSKLCLIEDYAHHPTELAAALSSLRKRFPERRLTVVFQPHRYARLEHYLEEFAGLLRDMADDVVVVPVFAAWTEKSAVTSQMLAQDIGPNALYSEESWSKTAQLALQKCRPPAVLAVIGAGDVNRIVPEILCLLSAV